MNRRSFLTALAAVAAAPQVGRRLLAQAAAEVRPFFRYSDNTLAHVVEGANPRWYIYPVSVPSGGVAVRSESDDLVPLLYPRYLEVRSDRPLTEVEVRARAAELLHTLHT